jgi:WS/DGAT/MGAT family acyltransferase
VVLATVSGAVGSFLLDRQVPVKGLDFRALIPVNVRHDADRGKLGNHVAMMLAPLPLGEPDPRRRLERVVQTTRKLKRSGQARAAELLEKFSDWMATPLMTQVMRLTAQVRTYNLIVTNVPGPPMPLYMLGARLLEAYPMVPLYSSQALGIAIFSYNGGLYWGLNSDWDGLRELHDLAEELALKFEELRKAAALTPVELR